VQRIELAPAVAALVPGELRALAAAAYPRSKVSRLPAADDLVVAAGVHDSADAALHSPG